MHDRRYYDDLSVGDVQRSSPHVVNERHMFEFARRYDPQYFHTDPEAAGDSIFGETIASGIYTMAIWRYLDHQLAEDIAWICGVAWDDVRFPKAVRAGDTLIAEAIVADKRVSRREPNRGVIKMHYKLLNQNEELVFQALSTNLIQMQAGILGR